jgi:hypothetical protein
MESGIGPSRLKTAGVVLVYNTILAHRNLPRIIYDDNICLLPLTEVERGILLNLANLIQMKISELECDIDDTLFDELIKMNCHVGLLSAINTVNMLLSK